jgi:tungstate transport system ATP-binding protein
MTNDQHRNQILHTNSQNESIYRIEDLKKEYSGRVVVDIERLDIWRGEMVALVGPSGAGKSTLLRLLNFLEPPSSGCIVYQGQAMDGDAPLDVRRQITTVFQRPVLMQSSVYENAAYGLRLRGQSADGRVINLLARVGLAELAKAPARKLSGGEMQRVALARALVIDPSVLLLDEPTANLDPYNISLIEDIVRRHNRERGTTVVLVTHNVFQARRLADRVGLMLNGRMIEVADTLEFFDAPSDPRTAAFVRGDMVY